MLTRKQRYRRCRIRDRGRWSKQGTLPPELALHTPPSGSDTLSPSHDDEAKSPDYNPYTPPLPQHEGCGKVEVLSWWVRLSSSTFPSALTLMSSPLFEGSVPSKASSHWQYPLYAWEDNARREEEKEDTEGVAQGGDPPDTGGERRAGSLVWDARQGGEGECDGWKSPTTDGSEEEEEEDDQDEDEDDSSCEGCSSTKSSLRSSLAGSERGSCRGGVKRKYTVVKELRFAETDRIVLIPARNDYDTETKDQLWWTLHDYEHFKQCTMDDYNRGVRDFTKVPDDWEWTVRPHEMQRYHTFSSSTPTHCSSTPATNFATANIPVVTAEVEPYVRVDESAPMLVAPTPVVMPADPAQAVTPPLSVKFESMPPPGAAVVCKGQGERVRVVVAEGSEEEEETSCEGSGSRSPSPQEDPLLPERQVAIASPATSSSSNTPPPPRPLYSMAADSLTTLRAQQEASPTAESGTDVQTTEPVLPLPTDAAWPSCASGGEDREGGGLLLNGVARSVTVPLSMSEMRGLIEAFTPHTRHTQQPPSSYSPVVQGLDLAPLAHSCSSYGQPLSYTHAPTRPSEGALRSSCWGDMDAYSDVRGSAGGGASAAGEDVHACMRSPSPLVSPPTPVSAR